MPALSHELVRLDVRVFRLHDIPMNDDNSAAPSLADIATDSVAHVLNSQVRLTMEKVAEERAKEMLKDKDFTREVLKEAKRAFIGAAENLRSS